MRTTRFGTVLFGTAAALLLLAGPASAHVTAHSDDAASGGIDAQISFRVPNEEGKAATTKVEIVLPADKPLVGVLPAPKPGWKVTTTSAKLKTPVTTDDGKIDTAVSTVTWTATVGGTPPGQYDAFDLAVGQLPKTGSLTFKALQTYSDGTVVRWIEPTVEGAEEPEHPAPVLALTTSTETAASPSATPSVTATTAPAAPAKAADDSTGKVLGGAGLGVGAVALLLALVGLRRSRSTSA